PNPLDEADDIAELDHAKVIGEKLETDLVVETPATTRAARREAEKRIPEVVDVWPQAVIVEEKSETLKDHASTWWNRAKAGYNKAQVEYVHETEARKESGEAGGWTKLISVVPGVATYRGTGTATPSAIGVLVEEEVITVEKPKPRPLPDLIKETTEDAQGLIHAELALAKSEIKQRAKIIGPAVGMFFVAAFIILYALSVLIWAAVFGLAVALPLWLSALIIGVGMVLIAVVLVLIGIRTLKKLGRIKFLAGGTIKDDIAAITGAFKTRNWANEQEAIKEGRL
ncbi:MAG: phage holin family protein, partial [Promicromonosporaceae bacterium]|nr:phage holin family protein [Promicromonosporaceae bacterium]